MNRVVHVARYMLVTLAAAAFGDGGTLIVARPLQAVTSAITKKPPLTLIAARQRGHWARYRVVHNGRGIDVYLAHDSQPKPLVIFLQGSGCTPLMTVDADGTFSDTSLFQDLIASRLSTVHVAMIDKRGVEPLRFSPGMTQQAKERAFERAGRECSAEYLQHVTKQERVDDVVATMAALAAQPWVRETILVGHSEGTHVTTGVLKQTSSITAAGLFASAGPIPFYAGYVARGAGDRSRLQSIIDQIRTLQSAGDDVMYQGLPVRRWKTFWLESTPIDDVRDSAVPLFVAQGSRDDTTLAADLFALEAIRQQPRRSLRYVVVEQGDHAFETPDRKSHLAELFDDFLAWALDAGRQTSLGTLKEH